MFSRPFAGCHPQHNLLHWSCIARSIDSASMPSMQHLCRFLRFGQFATIQLTRLTCFSRRSSSTGLSSFYSRLQEHSSLWLLGDPNLTFTASAVLDPGSHTLTAAVCNTASSAQPTRKDTLLSWPADTPAGTLASIAQRSSLPGCVHSLHPLFPVSVTEGGTRGAAAASADLGTVARWVAHPCYHRFDRSFSLGELK